MRIPVVAIYGRSSQGEKPKEPRMLRAEYHEVPDKLIMGAMAQAAIDQARVKHGLDGAEQLAEIVTKAADAGEIILP